jgi:UDP-N-acetylglucosamine 4,6-dehydratase
VALSTDKAAAPINLYGATKLCSDKLFVAANNITGGKNIRFSAVRYGNVMGSRGSVMPFFLSKRKSGVLPVTHGEMTRFNILLQEGVDLVIYAIENAWGGEIFVPKIPSFKILDLAKAIAPECKIEMVGMRPGEKIHEEMITESDSLLTMDIGKYYAILPHGHSWNKPDYINKFNAKPVPFGFRLSSGTNADWLSVEQLRDLIREHLDPNL